MRKYSIDVHRVHHSVRLVVTMFVLLGFLVQNVAGSVYMSLLMQSYTTVTSPPVIFRMVRLARAPFMSMAQACMHAASTTIYIALTASTNNTETSNIYVYLEILVPNTTTYAQYIITFEIT